jgi:Flp pilus assembly protein TadD
VKRGAVARVQAALDRARQFLAAGKHADAIEPLREAARLAPDNPLILSDLGTACLQSGRAAEAVKWLKSAALAGPTVARVQYLLGAALERTEDYPAALAAHQRAATLDPRLAEAHGRVAELLMPMGLQADAAAAFDRAATAAGDTAFGALCRAKAAIARGRSGDAEDGLRRVLERAPSNADAHELLAIVLNETGRFAEGRTHLERFVDLSPRRARGYFGLVASRRITETDRPLLARVLAQLDDASVPERQKMTLHFAAGKALDDLRDYGEAMKQFDAANAIRRRFAQEDRHLRFDRGDLVKRVDGLIARYTPEFFAAHSALGETDETPVLVLGMPRSGTTLIERIVSSHPSVAGGGELPYWNQQGLAWAAADMGRLGSVAGTLRDGYRDVLRGIGADVLRVTDKMPSNFFWIGLVHLLFPKARFVHCRRNAVDTCLSVYTTHFAADAGFMSDRADLAFYYREYLRVMRHWREVLPGDVLLDIDYEDVTANAEACAKKLVSFTGLPWDARCLTPEENPDLVKTASMWQARQPIYKSSVERWRNYEPWLGELLSLTAHR